jgi:hypothetical protein
LKGHSGSEGPRHRHISIPWTFASSVGQPGFEPRWVFNREAAKQSGEKMSFSPEISS